jgi:putative CocE/NonD family hydrolase
MGTRPINDDLNRQGDDCASCSEHGAQQSLMTRREVLQAINTAIIAAGSSTMIAEPALGAEAVPMGLRKVKEVETLWVPMTDGTRIAVRAWIPEDAERNPVPALMEYIPYRRRDGTRLRDDGHHPYWASFGYACIRPDIRGSGDSDGPSQDEYVAQEQDDGVEIIAWIAKQPWCTGKVGMFGISWGGFSALQVAARHPPALGAIITHCSTDDRYTDDAHYLGGCIVQDMFVWGSGHTTNGPRPPDPAIVGARWRDEWRQRCETLEPYVANWLSHQSRDAFWKHGSVSEDYSQIHCPVYAVGGWVDAYNCAIPRLLANLRVPRKGLIGPWGHQYPNDGNPGPAIDWMNEALRWWDHWLKGVDTGIMREPMLRVWMQNETALASGEARPTVAGRWVAEDSWPSPRIQLSRHYLATSGIDARPGPERALTLLPFQTVGVASPHWCPFNMPTELPGDQRIDDSRSLTFDSMPLDQPAEILGAPVAWLELSVDKPVAFLAVRLNEVSPEGLSQRVTYGVLNLCHRGGHGNPEALEPGRRYRIRVQLRDAAHRFAKGNRMRIAISTTYWPLIWPSPDAVTLTLYTGSSSLELPLRPPRADDVKLAAFGAPFDPTLSTSTVLDPGGRQTKISTWDVARRALTIRSEGPYSRRRIDAIGTETFGSWREELFICDDDPTSARLEIERVTGFFRPGWDVRIETRLRMRLNREQYVLTTELKTFDGGEVFFARKWEQPIPRHLI